MRFLRLLLPVLLLMAGCATLFGWDIHAPGILSENFNHTIQPMPQRMALYVDPELTRFVSKDKGSAMSDPQTYHVGEAFHPMLIEGFQQGFEEFIMLEVEPTRDVLKQYAIPYVAAVRMKGFDNRKGKPLNRQVITVATETLIYDSDLKVLAKFDSSGSSDSRKVFAKRGGPEVNLNAAIENDILSTVQFIQDWIRSEKGDEKEKISGTSGA